jgi:hypothetical protein
MVSVQPTSLPINDSYHCRRGKQDGLILIMNGGEYLMAEYSEHTGVTSYQRVVPAPQRDVIERWLAKHFPARKARSAAHA